MVPQHLNFSLKVSHNEWPSALTKRDAWRSVNITDRSKDAELIETVVFFIKTKKNSGYSDLHLIVTESEPRADVNTSDNEIYILIFSKNVLCNCLWLCITPVTELTRIRTLKIIIIFFICIDYAAYILSKAHLWIFPLLLLEKRCRIKKYNPAKLWRARYGFITGFSLELKIAPRYNPLFRDR